MIQIVHSKTSEGAWRSQEPLGRRPVKKFGWRCGLFVLQFQLVLLVTRAILDGNLPNLYCDITLWYVNSDCSQFGWNVPNLYCMTSPCGM